MNVKSLEWMTPERMAWIREYSAGFVEASKDVKAARSKAACIAEQLDSSLALERFFTRASAMGRRAERVKDEFPGNTAEMMKVAENALAHRFDILGSGPRDFGFPIQWHCDIRSGHCWPADAELLNMGREAFDILIVKSGGVELKGPWDLSNMHWLMTLACAWQVSGDPRFLQAIERDTTDWIDSNPPFRGVNWFCAMNVGIRALNVISAIASVHSSLDSGRLKKIMASLYLHGIHISACLEIDKGAKRNNHYLSNLIGLFFLGTLFKDCADGEAWLRFSRVELEREMLLEFKADGVCFEGSTSYHRLSTEIMLLCAMLGESSGNRFPEEFIHALGKSLGFTRDILQANQHIPQFGDNDNGRMLALFGYMTMPSTDHRHILALGGEFVDDDSIRASGTGAGSEAIWMLGHFNEPSRLPRQSHLSVKSYGASGFHIMKSADTTLVIYNGKAEQGCGGGHFHSDLLGFTMNYKGRDIFVDPGTYLYSSDFRERNRFRSTEYHNTVQVGTSEIRNFNRETFEDLWWMKDFGDAETKEMRLEGDMAFFNGSVKSYLQEYGIVIRRNIAWNDALGILKVVDSSEPESLAGGRSSAPVAVSRFLLAPGLSAETNGGTEILVLDGNSRIATLRVAGDSGLSFRRLWYSPEYGTRVPAFQIEVRWDLAWVNHVEARIDFNGAGLATS